MVCLGNICRSPLAEGILKSKAKNLEVDSAGTAGYHIGKQPDFRSIDIAKKHDIDLTRLKLGTSGKLLIGCASKSCDIASDGNVIANRPHISHLYF